MAKFLMLWEMDRTRMPVDPKEQLGGFTMLLNGVKADLEGGQLKDWGEFPGEHAGYAIMEGTEPDVLMGVSKYDPYVKFKIHSVLSLDQVVETVKALSQT